MLLILFPFYVDGKTNSPAKSMGFQGNNYLLGLLGRLRPKTQSPSGNWEGDLTFAKQVETISDQVSQSVININKKCNTQDLKQIQTSN